MRISQKLIDELKALLEAEYKRTLTNEDAQRIGLSVMRFVYAKKSVEYQPNNTEIKKDES